MIGIFKYYPQFIIHENPSSRIPIRRTDFSLYSIRGISRQSQWWRVIGEINSASHLVYENFWSHEKGVFTLISYCLNVHCYGFWNVGFPMYLIVIIYISQSQRIRFRSSVNNYGDQCSFISFFDVFTNEDSILI